jgi:hypothetical protein
MRPISDSLDHLLSDSMENESHSNDLQWFCGNECGFSAQKKSMHVDGIAAAIWVL